MHGFLCWASYGSNIHTVWLWCPPVVWYSPSYSEWHSHRPAAIIQQWHFPANQYLIIGSRHRLTPGPRKMVCEPQDIPVWKHVLSMHLSISSFTHRLSYVSHTAELNQPSRLPKDFNTDHILIEHQYKVDKGVKVRPDTYISLPVFLTVILRFCSLFLFCAKLSTPLW